MADLRWTIFSILNGVNVKLDFFFSVCVVAARSCAPFRICASRLAFPIAPPEAFMGLAGALRGDLGVAEAGTFRLSADRFFGEASRMDDSSALENSPDDEGGGAADTVMGGGGGGRGPAGAAPWVDSSRSGVHRIFPDEME